MAIGLIRRKIQCLIFNARRFRTIIYRPLFSFVSARGRILPKRVTRLSSKDQRAVARSIKTARSVGLMPYINS